MKTELIHFHASDGLELHGLLFTPEKGTDEIVISVHGFGSNFYKSGKNHALANALTAAGKAFLTFSNRGAELEREINDKLYGAKYEKFAECVFDIIPAIDFAKSRGYERVILAGHSLGCNKVTEYAIKTGFSGPLILIAPVDMARERGVYGIVNPTLHTPDTDVDLFRYRDGKINPYVAGLKNPVLAVLAGEDACIVQKDKAENADYLRRAFKSCPDFDAKIVPEADHSFHGHEDVLCKIVLSWLDHLTNTTNKKGEQKK
jgi:alpha-beta hydrolase superfamily lysophospholipase